MRRLAALLGVLALASTLSAQINKTDFANVADMVLVGSATTTVANTLRITDTVANQSGWAWYGTQQTVVSGFDTTFDFRITPGPVLAEGFAFIVQNSPTATGAVPTSPWTIGYGGMQNSLAVEIDTFQDGFINDTSANELTVHTRGTIANNENENFSIGRTTPPFSLSNSAVHTMRVRYVPGTLEVFIDNLMTPLISVPYDIVFGGTFLAGGTVGGLNLNSGAAWVGFSGTTGAGSLNERVEILNWTFTPTSPLDPCFDGAVPDGMGGTADVLLFNGSNGGLFRTVSVPVFEPLGLDVLTPPTASGPAMPFGILGTIGAADASFPGTTVFGSICFPIHLISPTADTFVFAENFGIGAGPLIPSHASPWSWYRPTGLPFPVTFTLQGFIATDLTNPNAIVPTNAIIVEVVPAAPPVVTGVGFPTLVPGAPLTISGTEFSASAMVTVGGIPVTPISVSPTAIVIPEPATSSCDIPVVVTNPDGQSASSTFNATPVVTNVINAMGSAAGGALLVIQGMNFAPGTTVTVGGTPMNLTTATPGLLIGLTPPGAVGTVNVSIDTPSGCSTITPYTYF